jgi:cellulose synthase (UDP-forming)
MTKILQKRFSMSTSELRGIGLVLIGTAALLFYYSWWFQAGRLTSVWLVLGFFIALFYGLGQVLANWLVYLGTHHRPYGLPDPVDLTVDVFVTACGEDHDFIEHSLAAACAMEGEHRTWLLDDGQDSALPELARRLGAGYLTRPERTDAKAGNVNAVLAHTHGDIIVIFDIDHVPQPDFLQKTLGCFADPKVGFVQVMPTFYNNRQGWVARAATETSLDFYNPTSKGMDAFSSATKMGTNSLIRRTALESIGGYQPGLAEDLATSIALHAAGWRSRYVAEPLAPGLAPPDLAAWFTQQFKWARGVFEILLTTYPRVFSRLTWGQRLSYAVRTTNYLIGPVIFIHLALVIGVFFLGNQQTFAALQQYFLYLSPLAAADILIRQLALRKWKHPCVPTEPLWRAVMLVYSTWPVYTAAWLMALFRFPLSFKPTPKSQSGRVNPVWLLPQLASVLLMIAGAALVWEYTDYFNSYFLLPVFAAGLTLPQAGLVRPLLRPVWRAVTGQKPPERGGLPPKPVAAGKR